MCEILWNKYSFIQWLGAVRQQAITWANVDPDLCRQIASLGLNELINPYHGDYARKIITTSPNEFRGHNISYLCNIFECIHHFLWVNSRQHKYHCSNIYSCHGNWGYQIIFGQVTLKRCAAVTVKCRIVLKKGWEKLTQWQVNYSLQTNLILTLLILEMEYSGFGGQDHACWCPGS